MGRSVVLPGCVAALPNPFCPAGPTTRVPPPWTPGEAERDDVYDEDVRDSDDTLAFIEEAAKLRNAGYHDHPVSLCGGMRDLPLLVRREARLSSSLTQARTMIFADEWNR